MPLVSDDQTFRFERFEGVYFWMKDAGSPVLCKVSHEALRDCGLEDDDGASLSDTFVRHRKRIEAIAGEKYDRGHKPDDLVVVLSLDLTPRAADDLRPSMRTLTPSRSRFPLRRARKALAGS